MGFLPWGIKKVKMDPFPNMHPLLIAILAVNLFNLEYCDHDYIYYKIHTEWKKWYNLTKEETRLLYDIMWIIRSDEWNDEYEDNETAKKFVNQWRAIQPQLLAILTIRLYKMYNHNEYYFYNKIYNDWKESYKLSTEDCDFLFEEICEMLGEEKFYDHEYTLQFANIEQD